MSGLRQTKMMKLFPSSVVLTTTLCGFDLMYIDRHFPIIYKSLTLQPIFSLSSSFLFDFKWFSLFWCFKMILFDEFTLIVLSCRFLWVYLHYLWKQYILSITCVCCSYICGCIGDITDCTEHWWSLVPSLLCQCAEFCHIAWTRYFITLCYYLSLMADKFKQQACIKFCVKAATETFQRYLVGQMQVFKWHTHFKDSKMLVEGNIRWPSTCKTPENVEKIRELINEDCHQTIH